MLARAATQLPQGPQWSYEVKFDGYRTLAIKDGPKVKLLSRNLKDATRLYPSVAREVARLRSESVLLDGEIVAVDEQGRPAVVPGAPSPSGPQGGSTPRPARARAERFPPASIRA